GDEEGDEKRTEGGGNACAGPAHPSNRACRPRQTAVSVSADQEKRGACAQQRDRELCDSDEGCARRTSEDRDGRDGERQRSGGVAQPCGADGGGGCSDGQRRKDV